jgi:hypothetical protein
MGSNIISYFFVEDNKIYGTLSIIELVSLSLCLFYLWKELFKGRRAIKQLDKLFPDS